MVACYLIRPAVGQSLHVLVFVTDILWSCVNGSFIICCCHQQNTCRVLPAQNHDVQPICFVGCVTPNVIPCENNAWCVCQEGRPRRPYRA